VEPSNDELLITLAVIDLTAGRWRDGLEAMRQARALDPLSVQTATQHAFTLLWMRRYGEAEMAAAAAVELGRDVLGTIQTQAMIALAQGDLTRARSIVADASRRIGATPVATYFAEGFDQYWLLPDTDRALLLTLEPSAFGNRGSWALALAETAHYDRRPYDEIKRFAEAARAEFQRSLTANPRDAQARALLGVALAYLGRTAEAVEAGEQAIELLPMSVDAYVGAYIRLQLVRICIYVGQYDRAVELLEPLLKTPHYLSPGWLRADPTFDPLRNHPGFHRLASGEPVTY
jgi:tetratricopeptide (TPR) repeat protein